MVSGIILLVLSKRMKQYHDTVNSKMDKLLVAEKAASRSEGVAAGRAFEKQQGIDVLEPQPVVIVQDTPVEVKVVEPLERKEDGTDRT